MRHLVGGRARGDQQLSNERLFSVAGPERIGAVGGSSKSGSFAKENGRMGESVVFGRQGHRVYSSQ